MRNWNISVKKKRFHFNKPRICFSISVHGMKTQKGGIDTHLKNLRTLLIFQRHFSVLKSHLSKIKLKSEISSSYTLNTKKPVYNSVCNESKNILYSWFCSHVHNVPIHPILTYQSGAKRKAKLFCHHKGVVDTCGKCNSIELKISFSFFMLVKGILLSPACRVRCSLQLIVLTQENWQVWLFEASDSCIIITQYSIQRAIALNLVGTEG